MSTKRKISVRRLMQLFVTLVVTTACVMAMLSASKIQDNTKLAGIDIKIKNERYGFIDKAEVKNLLLNNRHIDIAKTSFKKLDVNQMESIVAANPWVENAQAYVDNKRILHVNITQRVPVARLFEKNGNSYYLDPTLKSMPLSDRYIHYTTVVTNVPVFAVDSQSNALKAQIVALVKYIEKDSFWNAQISQIIVSDDTSGFELVPILGEQRILIGDTTNMSEKFAHLYRFYKKILNRIGWNKYQVLDLRFNGQIVASPALPWKKPQDNTMGNMSWVNSIISADNTKAAESDTPIARMPATVNAVTTKVEAKPIPPAPAAVVKRPVEVVKVEVKKPGVKMPEAKKQEVKKAPVVSKPTVVEHKIIPAAKVVKKEVKQIPAVQHKKVAEPVKKKETAKKETKAKEQKKTETAPKYIYQGSENNNQ